MFHLFPGVPGRIRTCNLLVRNQMLYPLSYGDTTVVKALTILQQKSVRANLTPATSPHSPFCVWLLVRLSPPVGSYPILFKYNSWQKLHHRLFLQKPTNHFPQKNSEHYTMGQSDCQLQFDHCCWRKMELKSTLKISSEFFQGWPDRSPLFLEKMFFD